MGRRTRTGHDSTGTAFVTKKSCVRRTPPASRTLQPNLLLLGHPYGHSQIADTTSWFQPGTCNRSSIPYDKNRLAAPPEFHMLCPQPPDWRRPPVSVTHYRNLLVCICTTPIFYLRRRTHKSCAGALTKAAQAHLQKLRRRTHKSCAAHMQMARVRRMM